MITDNGPGNYGLVTDHKIIMVIAISKLVIMVLGSTIYIYTCSTYTYIHVVHIYIHVASVIIMPYKAANHLD